MLHVDLILGHKVIEKRDVLGGTLLSECDGFGGGTLSSILFDIPNQVFDGVALGITKLSSVVHDELESLQASKSLERLGHDNDIALLSRFAFRGKPVHVPC